MSAKVFFFGVAFGGLLIAGLWAASKGDVYSAIACLLGGVIAGAAGITGSLIADGKIEDAA